jgi:hypothetical protein
MYTRWHAARHAGLTQRHRFLLATISVNRNDLLVVLPIASRTASFRTESDDASAGSRSQLHAADASSGKPASRFTGSVLGPEP